MTLVPKGIQTVAEIIVGSLYEFFTSVAGKYIKEFFPLIATFFLFIVTANWFGLLPGVGTVVFTESGKFLPILRGSNADLNMTLALAIISIVAIQYFGFKTLGFHYSTRYVNLKGPIDFFLGILEIISQFANILSFAFRLFGNIFAGEVLLTVMAFLIPFIVPLPFMALELFVGFIQALVFAMLTAAFLNVAVSHGEAERASHAA
jgi:F-type H+-transporting ATPase subunit a